jgi:hypothetical protein
VSNQHSAIIGSHSNHLGSNPYRNSDEIDTHAERFKCLGLLLNGVVTQAKSQGATEIITLCPPVFARTMRQLGFAVHVIGEPYVNMHDNRKYVAMKGKLDGVIWQNPRATAPTVAVEL